MEMDKNMSILFETADLDQASPATVSRCGMIYMDSALLTWETMHTTQMAMLQQTGMNAMYAGLFDSLITWLTPSVLEHLANCEKFLNVPEAQHYKFFVQFFMMLLNKQKQLNQIWFQQSFLFCFVWAFCSNLTTEGRQRMDPLIRSILYGNNLDHPKPKLFTLSRGQIFPEKLNFMDYQFDGVDTWRPWFVANEEITIPSVTQISEIIIPTKETRYISYWLNVCATNHIPISLIGPTGTGKSATILNFMRNLDQQKNILNVINFSARTTSYQTQQLILSKLDKRRKGIYGPPLGKKCLIFIDDVAMPNRDTYGSQPPLELLRQWMDRTNWYDLQDASKIELVDTYLNMAMGVMGGSNYIYPRIYRHTFVMTVDSFEEFTLTHIFASIASWHFSRGFDSNITQWAKPLASAMSFVYLRAITYFLPTPEKVHYAFSLRDITRIFQGIVQVPPERMADSNKLIRLWVHETYRIFHDRLIDDSDRNLLLDLVEEATYDNFRVRLDAVLEVFSPENDDTHKMKEQKVTNATIANIAFGSFMNEENCVYDEILDLNAMEHVVTASLEQYNAKSKSTMSLIMFRYALEHLTRICRTLGMPNGNMLLIGMGGSGRRTAVKLAAILLNANLVQMEIGQNYSSTDWRDDMKKVLMSSGLNGKLTILLLSDVQLRNAMYIDDVNSLLNTGDIPNLFGPDEISVILETMLNTIDVKSRAGCNSMLLYALFTERIRKYLHIALVFSPIGESFRTNLRSYPSIINCSTIDWFEQWPHEALSRVAKCFITSMSTSSSNRPEESADQHHSLDVCRELSTEETAVVELLLYFHESINKYNGVFREETGRISYVTPAAYLDLLRCYQNIYQRKYDEVILNISRYVTGLKQLQNAAEQVSCMQKKLVALEPELKILSEDADRIMAVIQRETVEVTRQQDIISADEAIANDAARAAVAIKDECDSDLRTALPVLESAIAALDTLKPADITIVKSMKNPPSGVKLVLEAVCVLRDLKPEKKPDAKGKMADDYWPASMRMLNDMKFIETLKNFDKDNMSPVAIKRIRDKYIVNPEFVPEKIKTISSACEGLCKWVRAMEVYDRTARIVGPKKIALAAAQSELDDLMLVLESKRAELATVMLKVKELNDGFVEKSEQKQNLQNEIHNCAVKLKRAESLIDGLLSEKTRWQQISNALNESLVQVRGDVLLSSACIAYIGPYTMNYRYTIIEDWKRKCIELRIPITQQYSLVGTLCRAVDVRGWFNCGLPMDYFSQQNGAIIVNSSRYPLLIDPQLQANKWIKEMEQKNHLRILQTSEENYLKTLQHCVSRGIPALIENVGENIDSSLFPLLERNVIHQKGGMFINFGGNLIQFSPDFRLYMNTCLNNPHYTPEISILVNILNFVITGEGLQEQLLSDVIIEEKPELQQLKETLIIESAENRDMLYKLETKILEVLNTSGDDILEDEEAIEILTSSKALSKEIEEKQAIATRTEKEIDVARDRYVPIAQHASCLFFCVAELSKLDSMYQYSIGWFSKLFKSTLKNTIKDDNIMNRIAIVQREFQFLLYRNVSRGLFERHKLILSFVIMIGLMRLKSCRDGGNDRLLVFLLSDTVSIPHEYENPAAVWLSKQSWNDIVRASILPTLHEFRESFTMNANIWHIFYEKQSPEECAYPDPYQASNPLTKLIIIKCLRPDRIKYAVQKAIIEELGKEYVEPPTFNLSRSFADSDPDTPIVVLLSSGSDPISSIFELARELNMYEKCYSVSLGQGQGPRAEKLIRDGREFGHWVILQNCHVATSWMHRLEMICLDKVATANAHDDFRLWCTSYPTLAFPVAVLQKSMKITNEPPRGIKLNMMNSYTNVVTHNFPKNDDDVLRFWHRGRFVLIFFHAVILERREYGPIGWNIPYGFNESDLRISLQQLQQFLDSYGDIPFEGHTYLTGECNYGGRVTDDRDRRLLLSLLNKFYNEESVKTDNVALSPCGTYRVPMNASATECLQYISTLPSENRPEVIGLHGNAGIMKNITDGGTILNGILLAQRAFISIESTSATANDESPILTLSNDILDKLPEKFILSEISLAYPTDYNNSMNTVLQQDARRYNSLLDVITTSLHDVQRAIKGEIAMIPVIESVCEAMCIGRLPSQWANISYPSMKPLSSYVNDLIARLDFLRSWITSGEPKVYWLPGFYFTQSFLTAILQNYARRHRVQIDLIELINSVTVYENSDEADEQNGVLINGLYLEGAQWNRKGHHLDEPTARILFDSLPIIDMIVRQNNEENHLVDVEQTEYDAPLYQTTERRGTLSTTGHSTNFIMFLQFASVQPISHWINRGTATFCQLNN